MAWDLAPRALFYKLVTMPEHSAQMSQHNQTTPWPDSPRTTTSISGFSDTDTEKLKMKLTSTSSMPPTPDRVNFVTAAGKLEGTTEDMDKDWEVDLENPRNWPAGKKWTVTIIGSLHAFCPIMASTMMAPGLPDVAIKYGITNPTVVALTLSIFLLSYGVGPLVFGPLSEIYGRTWVLHISNICTAAFNLGCAFSPNTGSLVAFRLLSGFTGGASLAIGGGLLPDLFAEADRGAPMAVFMLGMLIGPVVGPVTGGFIAQEVGIKWVFIALACLCGFASLIGIPLFRETYAPIVRLRKATRSNDPEAAKKVYASFPHANEHMLGYLLLNLIRPVNLLFRSMICFMFSLYLAFQFGIYYLMFSTFADFFSRTYGFSVGIGGLAYLGLGIGFASATMFGAKFVDRTYAHLSSKNGGVGKPEMRIPCALVGAVIIPVGVFWYGWSAQAKLHWIMPIIGSAIFGFGMMTTYLPIQLYLVDTFTYAASATAAFSLFRSWLGFAFPLFGTQMLDAMGQGGGNSLMAGLAIVLGIPFPIWIYFKGEEMRARNPLTSASVKSRPISVASNSTDSEALGASISKKPS